jgi:exodeoxyribonuclease VII small subunit
MSTPGGFEQSLRRLEAIVAELERADLPLEDSVRKFEEGMRLLEECRKELDAAEGKVEMLIRRAGNLVPEPLTLKDDPK